MKKSNGNIESYGKTAEYHGLDSQNVSTLIRKIS